MYYEFVFIYKYVHGWKHAKNRTGVNDLIYIRKTQSVNRITIV